MQPLKIEDDWFDSFKVNDKAGMWAAHQLEEYLDIYRWIEIVSLEVSFAWIRTLSLYYIKLYGKMLAPYVSIWRWFSELASGLVGVTISSAMLSIPN